MLLHGQRPPFRVSHVLFDVDGTLVDYGLAIRAAFAAAAEAASMVTRGVVTAEDIRIARVDVVEDPRWQRRLPTEQRRETMWRLLSLRGVTADALDSAVAAVLDRYQDARDRALTVYADVAEALTGLRARGFTLIAASNGDVDLGRVGIGEHIAATHYATDVGVAKPDPQFFALAMERFGVAPGHAIAVGDRVDNDYTAAREAGLAAVVIDRPARLLDAGVLRIDALTELSGLIETV